MQLSKSFKSLVLILGAGLIGLPAISHAENNWYVGASIGQSSVDEAGIDDEDTGAKLFGGYNFNKYFGIEIGYTDLGEQQQGVNTLEVDGYSIAAIATLPIGEKFSVHGKAGLYAWDLDTTGTIGSRFTDNSDSDAFYGVGMSYQFDKNWAVIGDWERYEIEDFDVDLVSVGISYRF